MSKQLTAGGPMPAITVPRLGGGDLSVGTPSGGRDWQLVVVYRGLHCPLCKSYLRTLETVAPDLHAEGVDVLAVSGDPEDRARAMVEETGLSKTVGYGLTLTQMTALGLYISYPRNPEETDRPFAEPGLFVVNDLGRLQIIDISNAPFARPDLAGVARGLKVVRANAYPVRGTHAA